MKPFLNVGGMHGILCLWQPRGDPNLLILAIFFHILIHRSFAPLSIPEAQLLLYEYPIACAKDSMKEDHPAGDYARFYGMHAAM